MDTEEFFRRVVAPAGHLVIAALRALPTGDKQFWNDGNYDAATGALRALALDNDPELTVYFGVGTHENNVEGKKIRRRQATAAWFKALAFDLDCGPGKPYATQKEGAAALYTALATFDFPEPLLVNSGNGLHVYWPLESAMTAARWTKVSTALRLALRDGGVLIDESKIHDSSMVLRPVGTWHKKQQPWKQVTVLVDCPDYPNLLLESKLAQWGGKVIFAKISAPAAAAPRKPQSSLAANILSGGFDPLDLDLVARGCHQVEALLASGGATDAAGADVREPMWRASLGVAKYTADPADAVVRLCGQHPEFDLPANLDKMNRWEGGVTKCSTFEQHCPAGCVACPSKGLIASPAALNKYTQITVTTTTPANATTGAAAFVTTRPALGLPPGYFARNSRIFREFEVEKVVKDAAGKNQKVLVMDSHAVCDQRLVVFGWFADARMEKSTIHGAIEYPQEGWKEFFMPADALGMAELPKYLQNKQITMDMQQVPRLRKYMTDFLNYIQKHQASGADVASFGWQADGGFVCGKNMIGGAGQSWRLNNELEKLAADVCTRGDRAAWVDMTSKLACAEADLIAFSMLVAGSGLLLSGSGIPCYVYSLFSEETGTGKTFSLRLGNTLFGHPTDTMLGSRDTENAVYGIMGSMGSLSVAIDEITAMDAERGAALAFQAQTGKEKRRLNATIGQREIAEWHAPLRVSTNRSLLNLYDNKHVKNEAEKARTLELRMDSKAWVSQQDMPTLQRVLEDNHGFAVPEIATEIMRRGTLREVYDAATAEFEQAFPSFVFEGDERFYRAGIIAAYGIGCIGRDLDLFRFNIEDCVQTVLDQVAGMRAGRVSSRQDCIDTISQFVSEFNKFMVVVREDWSNPAAPRPLGAADAPDNACIRMDIRSSPATPILGGSTLKISAAQLRGWTKKVGEDYNGLIDRLRDAGVLRKEERVPLYAGTYRTVPGRPICIVLDLTHTGLAPLASKPALNTNTVVALTQRGKP